MELKQRREFHYPLYRYLIRHIFRGRNVDKVAFFADKWVEALEKVIDDSVEIRGPAPAPLEKAKDFYRFHIWYFVSNVSRIIPIIMNLRAQFKMDKEVLDVFDVDPVDAM